MSTFTANYNVTGSDRKELVNLVAERGLAVAVFCTIGRLYEQGAVLAAPDVRVVACVQVNGHAHGVLRESLATSYGAVAETRGVVGTHLTLVVGIVFVGKYHALDRVTCFI